MRVFGTKQSDEKRLLLIYDMESQPFNVGDILLLQAAALVQCERASLDKVDMVVVFNSENPVVPDPAFSHITPDNFLVHLSSVLPAAQVNPRLGSLMAFDSHYQLEKYVADNSGRYVMWPPMDLYAWKQYLFYYCLDKVFLPFYQEFGWLPALKSRPIMTEWARTFIAEHAEGCIPVTLQLRNNPKTPLRNTDNPSWRQFLEHASKAYKAKFFVICSPHEVDPSMRALPNVVIAKDHYTSLEQDLALIESCAMHLGPASGPCTISWFNTKPYCMFSADADAQRQACLIEEEEGRFRYAFSAPHQLWIRAKENYNMIRDEFENLWQVVTTEAS
jgi:hypothetical protein